MTDLAALIADLEKASGPSRELDMQIFDAMGATKPRDIGYGFIGGPARASAPRYTESFDAARTLMPAGAEYEISTLYGVARVSLPLNFTDQYPELGERKDGNVPMAFVIACLKARMADTPVMAGPEPILPRGDHLGRDIP